MAKSESSKNWLNRHIGDHYVKAAQKSGYRSRAAFKLLEIQNKDRIIKPGQIIVDLGAAPGSWSQVAIDLVGKQGRVIALDLLNMDPLADVEFIQGDFTDQPVYDHLAQSLGDHQVDLVLSDMAPNITGMSTIDQPRSIYLCDLALDFASNHLKNKGDFLVKLFQGAGFDQYHYEMKLKFNKVICRKPAASRRKSREIYLLGKGFRG